MSATNSTSSTRTRKSTSRAEKETIRIAILENDPCIVKGSVHPQHVQCAACRKVIKLHTSHDYCLDHWAGKKGHITTCKKMKSFMKENNIGVNGDDDPKEGTEGLERTESEGGRNGGKRKLRDKRANKEGITMEAVKVKKEAHDSDVPAATDTCTLELGIRPTNIKNEDDDSCQGISIQPKKISKRPKKKTAADRRDAKKAQAHLAARRAQLVKVTRSKEHVASPARAGTPEVLVGYVPNTDFKYVTYEQEEESNTRAEPDVGRLVRW